MRSLSSARRVRRGFRPLLVERLEDRLVPSFFAPLAYDTGSGPTSVAAADFNGDGMQDLATANHGSLGVSVLLGNGDGSFRAQNQFAVAGEANFVAVGEFNGDGHLDLAVASQTSLPTLSVLLGNGDGSFQQARNFGAGSDPSSVAVGDFNGDGIQDLAVANSRGVSVLLGNGDGSFQEARDSPAGPQPGFLATGTSTATV